MQQCLLAGADADRAADLATFKDAVGYAIIANVSLNLLVNLVGIGVDTVAESFGALRGGVEVVRDAWQERRQAARRKHILGKLQGASLEYFGSKFEEDAALRWCRSFGAQRRWCAENGLDYRKLPAEARF